MLRNNLKKYRVLVGYGDYDSKHDIFRPIWFPVDFYAKDKLVRDYLITCHYSPNGRIFEVVGQEVK